MRYSETLVKDMHGQSAGPSYTQQRDEEGWGRGWGRRDGVGQRRAGQRRRRNKDLWFNLQKWTTEKFPLVYVFIAWLRWQKHHGVIKKKKKREKKRKKQNNLFLVSSVVALLQAEVFTESKVRGQQRFNTLVQARHSSWEFLFFFLRKIATRLLLLSGTCLPIVESTILPMAM